FTSVNAVEHFLDAFARVSLDVRSLHGTKLGCIGPTTAGALRDRGFVPDIVPEESTGEGLVDELGDGAGQVLLPRVEGAPQLLPSELASRGWRVTEVVAYRNLAPPLSRAVTVVLDKAFDVITFASASSVRHFIENVATPTGVGVACDQDEGKVVVCIGPSTAAEAAALGMRVDATAKDHSTPGLVEAVITATRR
ncbi:MAG: uroporphyrinogen-III synthase, partial [Actinomycetota bacterium]|nr:uroporphyrinogen-III synthase [Actinomycetota bacterium]